MPLDGLLPYRFSGFTVRTDSCWFQLTEKRVCLVGALRGAMGGGGGGRMGCILWCTRNFPMSPMKIQFIASPIDTRSKMQY